MFTGFASENTPAIQVWEYAQNPASTSALRSISLTDDCAPIQYFKTGGSSFFTVDVYLPSSPIEGKQIRIANSRYGSNTQALYIYSSDTNAGGTSKILYTVGPGQTLELCYSKNFISFGPTAGTFASGWIALNQAPVTSANSYGIALGNNNYASGPSSFIGGGSINGTTADSSGIVGGSFNTASAQNSFVGGGSSNTAGGNSSSVLGGSSNTANGQNAAILGGSSSSANAQNSIVVGGAYATTRSIIGNTVLSASLNPIQTKTGAQQSAILVLGRQTTDATATVLTSNTSAAATTNQVILPDNSAYYFKGSITAGVTGAGNSAMWSFEGGIKRGAGVGTTVLVGTPVLNVVAQDAGASTWVVALTANTTNGGLAVTVTGQASTTIRWVCKVETTEMTF
jgi:hypothetical protein